MDEPLNIVWLPGWFPSRVDPLTGDFIERHARAVSAFASVTVLYVVKDSSLKHAEEIVKETIGKLTIYRCYYKGSDAGNNLSKISSTISFYKQLFALYKLAKKEQGNFDLCHLHVPLRQSILATRLKKREGLSYVITEHNSWYAPGNDSFLSQPVFLKKMIRRAYDNTAAIHVVSRSLGDKLNAMVCPDRSYTVIPNVVDTRFFSPSNEKHHEPVKFITVSGDNHFKNTDGIIRAFAQLVKSGANAVLHIVGPGIEAITEWVSEQGIVQYVIVHGAVSNEQVAMLTKQFDAMLFFTRSETFGCVMAESLCCGVPVIASKIPVLEENLTDNVNALFVQPENEDDLVKKMNWFIMHRNSFDTVAIAGEASKKYSYHTVALQFMDFYNKALQTSK